MPSTSDLGKNIVQAFNCALREDLVAPESGLPLADLMLELASLYQYLGMTRAGDTSPQVRRQLQTCRERVTEICTELHLPLQLPQ